MIYKEEHRNLFTVDKKYWLAHCISSDCAMGAGIAVQFQKFFHIRKTLLAYSEEDRKHPTCIRVGIVFNLITKSFYWNKPTYNSLKSALHNMKIQIINENIKYLAMPKIGSDLDKLQWGKVREIIHEVFDDVDDLEILICYI